MDYIYLALTLIPVITITIAAKFIISSLDSQVDTLVALTNYQEEEIASLKALIDNYEDTLVDINSMNHPKSFDKAQDEYDYQSDEDFVLSV